MKKTMIGSVAAGVLVTVGLLLGASCDHSFEARLGRPRPFASDGSRDSESGKVLALSGTANTDFKVIFFGLIVVANTDTSGNPAKPRRALLVEGDTGMLHEPLLIVDEPAEEARAALKAALDAVTGHVTDCRNSKYRDSCVVNVAGVAMRIRDTDGNLAISPLGNHPSFSIVPSLKARARSTHTAAEKELVSGLLTQKVPTTPMASYFEIDGGGTLEACPFANGGNFAGGSTATCEQFASDVYWLGKTTKPTVLQLASKLKTDGSGDLDWKTIPVANTGRLVIAIANEPSVAPTGPSTKHFNLFKKVLKGATFPDITSCPKPKCPGACVTCTKPKVIVPGCSDSQWP